MKLLFVVLFAFQYAYAGIIGETKITGRVVKYDKNTVTLSQYGNRTITVPRKSIKKRFFKKLKTGIVVTAVFSAEEIMEKIKAQSKK